MNKQLLALYSRVPVPDAVGGGSAGFDLAARLNAEVGTLGYTLQRTLAARLAALPRPDFDIFRAELLVMLSALSGENLSHRTLFDKFPYEGPGDLSFLWNWILGARHRMPGVDFTPTGRLVLDRNGMIIDLELAGEIVGDVDKEFDRVPFTYNGVFDEGWDGLHDDDQVRFAFARVTPLKPILLADNAYLIARARDLLGRGGSLSVDEKTLLGALPRALVAQALQGLLAGGGKLYREQLPFAYVLSDDLEAFRPLVTGASDVLRVSAYLSDRGADLSLKDPVRFKLRRRDKRNMLALLEGCPSLIEDLMRHRERWLRFGEVVNPGSAANQVAYPKVAAAFDALRNRPEDIGTFNRAVEAGLRSGNVDETVLAALSRRPGEFARRLDWLLRTAGDGNSVLAAFKDASRGVPTGTLLGLRKFVEFRCTSAGRERVFVPKGKDNRVKVMPDTRKSIDPALLAAASAVIGDELRRRFSELPPLGKVWLDPKLKGVVLPFNRRGDSKTSAAVSKGSHHPLPQADVFRLFVHWTGEDVDLSASLLNRDFEEVATVAFTSLREFRCVHSGDVRSAPNGASEFIDFEVSDLLENGVRYVVATVISFCGGAFSEFPCFAGVMARDGMKSGKKFEAASVELKFELEAETTQMMPLIFDLEEQVLVFTDVASGGGSARTAVGAKGNIAVAARALMEMPLRKPTAWDVLELHAAARGAIVESLDESDVAWSASNIDIEWVASLAG